MKVNIDLRYSLGYGGISNYIRNIATIMSMNKKIECTGCNFWYHNRNRETYSWFRGDIKESLIPEKLTNIYKLGLPIPYELATGSFADINLFLTYRIPKMWYSRPVVSTIHDIILLKAKTESDAIIAEHKRILRNSIQKSQKIITVSEASKKDIEEYFCIPSDRIGIVHNGIDFNYFDEEISDEELQRVKDKYNLPQHFILNFGAYRKHKNIERLIVSYARIPETIKKDVKLVLTRSSKEIDDLVASMKLGQYVTFTGFIEEDDKKTLYKLADVIYYASLYEGFGVPVIEAQACGTPVLTSNISSLPEAAGGAAVLVNPYSEEEISDGLIRLLEDTHLRENLISKGKINSRQYSWNRACSELEQILLSM